MRRLVDRGAITAAYVGIGMAVTVAISFLLVIPIEPIVIVLALPSGLLIGYYANQRSGRGRGPWGRLLANAVLAAAATGLSMAIFLLAIKALFFFGDNGYRDESAGGSIACTPGADCVYQRYLAYEDGQYAADLAAAGVTDAATFTPYYWDQQLRSAGLILGLTVLGGIGGAIIYGVTRPRPKVGSAAAA